MQRFLLKTKDSVGKYDFVRIKDSNFICRSSDSGNTFINIFKYENIYVNNKIIWNYAKWSFIYLPIKQRSGSNQKIQEKIEKKLAFFLEKRWVYFYKSINFFK